MNIIHGAFFVRNNRIYIRENQCFKRVILSYMRVLYSNERDMMRYESDACINESNWFYTRMMIVLRGATRCAGLLFILQIRLVIGR